MPCQNLCIPLLLAVLALGNCNPVDYDSDVGRKIDSRWSWNIDDYPNPQTDFTKCGQSKLSTICDPDRLLTNDESNRLNELIQRLRGTSPCLCDKDCATEAHNKGLVVGVALMKTAYHTYNQDKNVVAIELSQAIMKKWNLGTCGNEILIVIIADLKSANIETGDAVKEFIAEETIQDIFEACKDYLSRSDYYEGLESIINSLYDTIQGKLLKAPSKNEEEAGTSTGNIGLTIGLVVGIACLAGFVVVGFLVFRRKRRNNGNQNGFMYDGSSGRQGSRNIKRDMIGPIVKSPVVFPDAVYQPCSIDDAKKTMNTQQVAGSDDEDDVDNEDRYLRKLEENPAYEPADTAKESRGLRVAEEGHEHAPAAVEDLNDLNKLPLSRGERNVDFA